MKDYKRLTKRCGDIVNYAKPLQSNFIGAIYEEQKERDSEIMSRLAELEDKIESGELCDRKTCKNITDKNPVDEFVCSSCEFIIDDFSRVKVDDDGEVFHYEYEIKYCPNCGAKVEDEE